ncbi:unnamed protein product [Malus baccata var. baccata]
MAAAGGTLTVTNPDSQSPRPVSDKKDLAVLGNGLQNLGYKIVSTGGTASALKKCWTFDGRVKTLHPNVHGGILARRDQTHHMEALSKHGIGTFDVVVVNLYPFYDKNIDIDGPAMIRAAAKVVYLNGNVSILLIIVMNQIFSLNLLFRNSLNHKDVLVVVDSEDYPALLEFLKGDKDDQQFRRKLAWKAFQHVASYDSAVSEWLWKQTSEEKFSQSSTVPMLLKSPLRYGENPHQKAAFYVDKSLSEVNAGGIATAIRHHGKLHVMIFLKHTGDPVSAFGGIVAFNIEVDEALAKEIREFRSLTDGETRMFYEIVVAPQYTKKGPEILRGK